VAAGIFVVPIGVFAFCAAGSRGRNFASAVATPRAVLALIACVVANWCYLLIAGR
jgi:hypothetical protein